MPYLVDVQTAFPAHYYQQEDLVEALLDLWKEKIGNKQRVKSIQQNVQVKGRHLALELPQYLQGLHFGQRNDLFIEHAVDLAGKALTLLFNKYNIKAEDISSLWSNTVTGFAVPSLEARVMNKHKFRPDTKRVPLMGLGCMAGVAGINRVADYLIGHPKEAAIFFSVELCSLTFQLQDISVANFISTGLFGDGAAAVLMVGDEHPLVKEAPLYWVDSKSAFFPDSEAVMGWDIGEHGQRIILSKSVPDISEKNLPEHLLSLLHSNKLELKDITSFFAHPGGPKVLLALEKVLGLPAKGLHHSWDSLEQNGNMSSVSVLDIFSRTLKDDFSNEKNNFALSVAMGPAFSAEIGLFKWA